MAKVLLLYFLKIKTHISPPLNYSHPQDGINYYVVALARRSSSDLSLLEMHERSSCHPGIRTTVGWTVPIGFLVNTSQISVDEQCNFPHGESQWVKEGQKDNRGFGNDEDSTGWSHNPQQNSLLKFKCSVSNGFVCSMNHNQILKNIDPPSSNCILHVSTFDS